MLELVLQLLFPTIEVMIFSGRGTMDAERFPHTHFGFNRIAVASFLMEMDIITI